MLVRERMRETLRYDLTKEEMMALMYGDYMNKIDEYI